MNSIRVLIAPLDWGLGHASRMVRLIVALKALGCEIVIAGSGHSLELLKREFPELTFEALTPYDPVYDRSGWLIFSLVRQSAKFIRTIRREHDQTREIAERHNIDLIISDNRYGCWSSQVDSIFVTHQVNLLLPSGWKWMEGLINLVHRAWISKFHQCWVPDWQGPKSLVPALSQIRSARVRYIGPISRFEANGASSASASRLSLLIILSGPEPQRSIFESALLTQVEGIGSVCLVRGVPDENLAAPSNVIVKGLVPKKLLQDLIESANIVVARPGYSTLMDLVTLGGKAIFIPTPGQTEQEYIARLYEERGLAYFAPQRLFDLHEALAQSKFFEGFLPTKENDVLTRMLEERIQWIKARAKVATVQSEPGNEETKRAT